MKLAEAHIKLNQVDKSKAPMPGKNKGDRGQWVESQIGLENDKRMLKNIEIDKIQPDYQM